MTDFIKGQKVTFARRIVAPRASGWGSDRTFFLGDSAEVTAVRKNTITVSYSGYSYNVPRADLDAPNGEAWDGTTDSTGKPKAKTRKLGEVPEGAISPDDPGIQWLFEDMAKVASNYNYCYQYDELADKLNIPGRIRDISITVKADGLSLTATVKARSRKEAEELVKAKINGTVTV